MCGYSAVATVGRHAPWLPKVCRDRSVILAFDGNHPGDAEAKFMMKFLKALIVIGSRHQDIAKTGILL